MSNSIIPKGYTILPVNLPSDIPQLLRLHYQLYLSGNTMQAHPPEGPISETEFIAQHSSYMHAKFSEAHAVLWKLVLATDSNLKDVQGLKAEESESGSEIETGTETVETANPPPLVAYIGLRRPQPLPDRRSVAERQCELRAEVETMPCESEEQKALSFELMWKGKMLNEAFLSSGYEARYWLLDALYVDQRWQRRGLGSALVQWGVEFAKGEEGRCLNEVDEDVVMIDAGDQEGGLWVEKGELRGIEIEKAKAKRETCERGDGGGRGGRYVAAF